MTNNKNILQAYLKFLESNFTCTVNTRIDHQNGRPWSNHLMKKIIATNQSANS